MSAGTAKAPWGVSDFLTSVPSTAAWRASTLWIASAVASTSGLCYNNSIWCLNPRGFFRAASCHFLSNCCGPRDVVTAGIRGKLDEIRARGGVTWAEPPGDTEVSLVHPTIDVRHGSNFTGGRESSEGYFSEVEYWGAASLYTRLF